MQSKVDFFFSLHVLHPTNLLSVRYMMVESKLAIIILTWGNHYIKSGKFCTRGARARIGKMHTQGKGAHALQHHAP